MPRSRSLTARGAATVSVDSAPSLNQSVTRDSYCQELAHRWNNPTIRADQQTRDGPANWLWPHDGSAADSEIERVRDHEQSADALRPAIINDDLTVGGTGRGGVNRSSATVECAGAATSRDQPAELVGSIEDGHTSAAATAAIRRFAGATICRNGTAAGNRLHGEANTAS